MERGPLENEVRSTYETLAGGEANHPIMYSAQFSRHIQIAATRDRMALRGPETKEELMDWYLIETGREEKKQKK